MAFSLSPTELNLMVECPRCFWLDKHGIWKRPRGAFPSLSSGIDKILKNHFDKFIGCSELPPELAGEPYCRGMALFSDRDLLKKWRNNFEGIFYIGPRGNRFRGAVDNLLVNGSNLVVLDYKTRGFPLKQDSHEHYALQLDSYNYLLRKNKYSTEDYSFLLFYIPKEVEESGKFIFDTTLVKVATDPKRAEDKWSEALHLLNNLCPKKQCEHCDGKNV